MNDENIEHFNRKLYNGILITRLISNASFVRLCCNGKSTSFVNFLYGNLMALISKKISTNKGKSCFISTIQILCFLWFSNWLLHTVIQDISKSLRLQQTRSAVDDEIKKKFGWICQSLVYCTEITNLKFLIDISTSGVRRLLSLRKELKECKFYFLVDENI